MFTSNPEGIFVIPRKRLISRILIHVYRFVTDWVLRKSDPSGEIIFCARLEQPRSLPGLLYNEYLVFPGGKDAGMWC